MRTNVAPCTECGAMVVMAKVKGTSLARAMDSWAAPVPVWTLDEYGYLQPGGVLVEHGCDVGVVEQFRATWLGQAGLAESLAAQAYAVPCPKCGAEVGVRCANLIERVKGREQYTRNPHQERYPMEEPA